jgi:uncharacterized damage-inducible protein DinB
MKSPSVTDFRSYRGQITAAITAMGYPCPEIDLVWMLQAEGEEGRS